MANDKTPIETGEESDAKTSTDASSLLLKLKNISKRFPGVIALDGVDFDLKRGEVHVLFGENGAGKSTLTNIVAGTYPPDRGDFYYQGRRVTHQTPHQARLAGISPVFQEFSLVPDLTVGENLYLGRERTISGVLRKGEMRRTARRVLQNLGFDLDPGVLVRDLMRAQQQMVEIAKALLQEVTLLILDEPTSSLTELETERLFKLIDRLKSQNVGIIYVSHRMAEIKRIGDRITVLRDGRKIATVESAEVSEMYLVEMMTGRKIDVLFPKIDHRPRETILEIKELCLAHGILRDISVDVRAGEIAGIAGLIGCGKSEVARAVFGLERITAGKIQLFGQSIKRPTPRKMLKLGLCYFPSDRVSEGLAIPRAVRENASMVSLDLPVYSRFKLLRRRSERRAIRRIAERLQLRPPNIERAVAFLSGGNRQKVMLMRGLTRDVQIFLFDEPTVGIDVGAKTEVYELMKELVESGAAVLLVSSELPEVVNLCNRVYVMRHGRLVNELQGEEITETNVLAEFFEEVEQISRRTAVGKP